MEKTKLTWLVPIRTVSEANSSEHWSAKSRRHKNQQFFVRRAFFNRPARVNLPCTVKLCRLAPRSLDSDNLTTSLKYIRDEIAEILIPEGGGYYLTKKGATKAKKGHSDSDPRITWEYAQEKFPRMAVRIEILFDDSGM